MRFAKLKHRDGYPMFYSAPIDDEPMTIGVPCGLYSVRCSQPAILEHGDERFEIRPGQSTGPLQFGSWIRSAAHTVESGEGDLELQPYVADLDRAAAGLALVNLLRGIATEPTESAPVQVQQPPEPEPPPLEPPPPPPPRRQRKRKRSQ